MKRLLVTALLFAAGLAPAFAADLPPLRTITDNDPNFNTLWVDTVNREIVVANDAHETIQVYSSRARGVVAPLREIKGPNTFVSFPGQVFVDPVHDELWSVGNDIADMVTIYARTADGNAAPIRRIVFKPLGLNRTWGLAVDLVNDEVALTHQRRSRVTVWSRTTNTDVNPTATPLRTLSGAATQLADPAGVFIDPASNEMYVVNLGHRVGSITAPSITVYARTAAGNTAPLRKIQGPSTGLDNAKPIFVDTERREIVVANGNPSNALLFFDQDATGDVAPKRVIQGARTGLSNPTGVFVDAEEKLIWVANWGNHTLTAFKRTAQDNAEPERTISPTTSRVAAGIGNPGALYVDTERDEIGVLN